MCCGNKKLLATILFVVTIIIIHEVAAYSMLNHSVNSISLLPPACFSKVLMSEISSLRNFGLISSCLSEI